MKKQNGFTLVEVIAVIAILGVITTIVMMNSLNVYRNSKEKVGEYTKSKIEDAATLYALDYDCEENCKEDTACSILKDDDEGCKITLDNSNIEERLSPYYPEMLEKCNIGSSSEIIINNYANDVEVSLNGQITCER